MTERRAGTGRVTPWHVVFGAPGFGTDRFERVQQQQAQTAGAPSPMALLMLPAAGELLRELLPHDAAEPPDASYRDAAEQAGALLFHAYRFWLHGLRVHEIGRSPLEAALSEHATPDWRFTAPAPAGYVQLPHQLFWARVADDAAPEPVDGFFWSAPFLESPDSADPLADRLDLLLALGVRRGRPGVSLVDISVEPALELERWAGLKTRPDGDDFANILPGGELQGYRALTTRAEALKLAMICFRLLAAHGHADGVEDGGVMRHRLDG